jgi:DNA-directed RNA polymerase subunit M/transcription elongation factor TFIIS
VQVACCNAPCADRCRAYSAGALLVAPPCSNGLLYPKEDKLEKKLYYGCRNCTFKQEAASPCVYVNEIKQSLTYVHAHTRAGGEAAERRADTRAESRRTRLHS